MNKWIGAGRITKDIELQTGKSGSEYCKFSVAVNRRKDKNGETRADFIDCTAFGKTAAFVAKYFKKGDGIVVEGALESDTYEAKDGTKRTKWSIRIEEVEFPQGGKKQGDQAQTVANWSAEVNPADIPF